MATYATQSASNTSSPKEFSDAYADLLQRKSLPPDMTREAAGERSISEQDLQALWYAQSFSSATLRTVEGHTLEVVSPGWWNQQAGPDFRGAQLLFNGTLFTGDVEIHLGAEGWQAHGHHKDVRYEGVILHVVLDLPRTMPAVETRAGRRIPLLVLRPYLDMGWPVDSSDLEEHEETGLRAGACSALLPRQGLPPLLRALELAAEWRMLNRARLLAGRMERAGGNQALYEALMYAAGVSPFKYHFQEIARQLPYDRAVQLAHHDPLLLEAALLQIGCLLPESLGEEAGVVPHHARLCALQREHLPGMRPLPLVWKRNGLRPANYPERRLSGMARVLSRTAGEGLLESVMQVWRAGQTPKAALASFQALFPKAMGFWATHYTWAGKHLEQAAAPLGAARVQAMVGNVFIAAGLAVARARHDRALEEQVLDFFRWLPKESSNQVLERMEPKLMGDSGLRMKTRFQLQQGMLQFHQDWCGPNPSCRNCSMCRYLDQGQLRE